MDYIYIYIYYIAHYVNSSVHIYKMCRNIMPSSGNELFLKKVPKKIPASIVASYAPFGISVSPETQGDAKLVGRPVSQV